MAISPSGYYQSIYSGEEIDNAIGEIPEIQTALSNKAPAGFGFGEKLVEIKAESEDESYETFCAKIDAYAATLPNVTAALVAAYPPAIYGLTALSLAVIVKSSADYIVLRNLAWAEWRGYGWQMIRRKTSQQSPSSWLPFEWSNPPLQVGVEYRTTERYGGKPVYVKRISLGAVVNGEKAVALGVTNLGTIIRFSGVGGGTPLPCWFDNSLTGAYTMYVTFRTQEISGASQKAAIIVGNSGAVESGYTAETTFYYTKTTD